MKIPVIRGKIGNWRYYTGVLSFQQIADNVKSSIKEFYEASCLSELLQRDLTENFSNIKYYLENDEERFFNALVLAIYNGDPKWLEVEFSEEESDISNVGFLQFSGEEVIFPVDGQHRVAGIKAAITEIPSLSTEQVPVIFIAHESTPEGKKRTRKLFSTLNRRAKPVGDNENIALDEDDVNAIITRALIDDCKLFVNDRVINSPGKQIPITNTQSFTSLITLYQCNEIILKDILANEGIKGKRYNDYLLYRPTQEKIDKLSTIVFEFWNEFISTTKVIHDYLSIPYEEEPAKHFRNQKGGNILFRPVALTEYVSAVLSVRARCQTSIHDIMLQFNEVEMNLNAYPWKGVIWDGKNIIGRVSKSLIRYLLIYMYDKDILTSKELDNTYTQYKSSTNSDDDIKLISSKLDAMLIMRS